MYIIRKYDRPVKIMYDGVAYDVDPEYCRINIEPLNGPVFKRDNVEVHKLLKSLTKGTKNWNWIDKSKVGRDDTKTLREHYNGSAEGGRCMNITKADMKELYFKHQDVLPFEKYVNRLKEAYSTLE